VVLGKRGKEGSSSFLKKRTKKLLLVAVWAVETWAGRGQARHGKSFLLLFFKKEALGFACEEDAP
jgi:hypothetical protein